MDKVIVIISTYNGEQYIRQQLDSVLDQTYDNIQVLIRDDGSSDSTVDILKEYCERFHNVTYYSGDNVGIVNSFYNLLEKVPEDAKYIAGCDQDDVWLPDKIEVAVAQLESIDGAALYCGRPQLTDKDLNQIEDNLRITAPHISFGNAMIENVCVGCTMMFNRELYDILKVRWPRYSLMHDWWIFQVAVCFGKVVYDETPHIYYRQHGDNEVGMDVNRRSLIKRQIRSLNRFRGKYTRQMGEFIEIFSPTGENGELANAMVGTRTSFSNRWKILFDKRIYRQGRFDTLLFKGMLFLGLL